MNIDWKKYINYAFCINYLQNNRIADISKTLQDIGIDIYDNRFFSFIYDNEHKIFQEEENLMRQKSYKFYVDNAYWDGNSIIYNNRNYDYLFNIGLTTYKALKIAQYFKYKRIIIFEDDIIFLKDTEYIINALEFLNTQSFDICLCQTTFCNASYGIKKHLIEDGVAIDLGNDMFLKTTNPLGVYGGGCIILTNNGINKLVNFYELNEMIICIDVLDLLRHITGLETLFALKPLCIQNRMIDDENIKAYNDNINIDEYKL